MKNFMVIICILLMAVLCFIEYLKDKKVYRLLAIISAFIVIYMVASNISKTFENTLLAIVIIISIAICYLLIKEEKSNEN